jgi:hypothetical protein
MLGQKRKCNLNFNVTQLEYKLLTVKAIPVEAVEALRVVRG